MAAAVSHTHMSAAASALARPQVASAQPSQVGAASSSLFLAVPNLSAQCRSTPSAAPVCRPVTRASAAASPAASLSLAAAAEVMSSQKIRIKLRAYDVPQIEEASEAILAVARSTGSATIGPVRLPTHIRRYCVLRSPHVDKDSREHFEIRTHKRLIDLTSPTPATIDALMQIDLPYGVEVDVKLT